MFTPVKFYRTKDGRIFRHKVDVWTAISKDLAKIFRPMSAAFCRQSASTPEGAAEILKSLDCFLFQNGQADTCFYEVVYQYRANDGRLFKTKEDARRATYGELRKLIWERLDRVGKFESKHEIVEELVGTTDKARRLKEALSKYV